MKKQPFILNHQILYDNETPIKTSNIIRLLTDRQTTDKRLITTVPGKPIILGRLGIDCFDVSLNTLDFHFINNKLRLTRYFNNNPEKIKDFIDKLKESDKPIYKIETYDDYLVFDTCTDIYYSEYYTDAQESYTSYLNEEDLLINTNIYGKIIDVNNIPQHQRTYLSNDIEFIHFLFTDTNDNYYYINYTAFGYIFNLFSNVYDKNLELLLYKDVLLKNKDEVETFIHQFQHHKDDYYATSSKRILKKYV